MASSLTKINSKYDYDIDGGILEGGGQILRNTVAYAVLFNKTIRIRMFKLFKSYLKVIVHFIII